MPVRSASGTPPTSLTRKPRKQPPETLALIAEILELIRWHQEFEREHGLTGPFSEPK